MRAASVALHEHWPAARRRGTVTLDWDHRHRRRLQLTCDDGAQVLLDLSEAVALRDGDGLVLDDGGVIEVRAAAEPVCDVYAGATSLTRLAWHLGNRHLPVEIRGDCLRIRDDHVIAAMLEGLGARIERLRAPFSPEGGAYAGHHDH